MNFTINLKHTAQGGQYVQVHERPMRRPTHIGSSTETLRPSQPHCGSTAWQRAEELLLHSLSILDTYRARSYGLTQPRTETHTACVRTPTHKAQRPALPAQRTTAT